MGVYAWGTVQTVPSWPASNASVTPKGVLPICSIMANCLVIAAPSTQMARVYIMFVRVVRMTKSIQQKTARIVASQAIYAKAIEK